MTVPAFITEGTNLPRSVTRGSTTIARAINAAAMMMATGDEIIVIAASP